MTQMSCPLQEGNQVLGQCMGNFDLQLFTMVSEIGQFAVSGKRTNSKMWFSFV